MNEKDVEVKIHQLIEKLAVVWCVRATFSKKNSLIDRWHVFLEKRLLYR
jgi:hypothetical protein